MYDLLTVLGDGQGHVLDDLRIRVGLRTIVWTPKRAEHPLSVAVDGRPFFVKGANRIPTDALNARVDTGKYRRRVAFAKGRT